MSARRRQVERIYNAALERGAEGRAEFLEEACAGDEGLRREVESLLGREGRAEGSGEAPARTPQAEASGAVRRAALAAGQRVEHYEVISPLGAGGMGEVYLAEDTRLGRRVALKLLPAHFTQDVGRLRRFEREARAVASLSHPNVCTIHEVVETEDGRRCIVMEYVEGATLRAQLAGKGIEIKKALGLAAQVADGLAAAHRAGVVHRDIKPENLLVTAGRQIKILDFGLAKLVEPRAGAPPDSLMTTVNYRRTDFGDETATGVILGTVSYMSPEQAEGRDIDQRADLFSLGVVLYEMLTGEKPFKGRSAVEILHDIINREPTPASEINTGLSAEVDDILEKALAKDPEERYHHAKDFELDLRRLRRAVESGSPPRGRALPAAGGRRRRSPLVLAAAYALLAATVALAAWVLGRPDAPAGGTPARTDSLAGVTLTPLTTDAGYEGEPTYSPDGETIAYTSDRTGDLEIFMKQISGGPDINLTSNSADDAQPAFSPDGKQIAFVSARSGASGLLYFGYDLPLMGGDVWVMPALGGGARRIAVGGNFPSWAPDGSGVVYTSGPQRKQKILRVAASGGDPVEIPISFGPGEPPPRFLLYPSYSSDGRWILFAAESPTAHTVYVVGASGGEPRRVVQGRRPAWGANSEAIIYTNDERGKNHSLWRIPFDPAGGNASGEARPLTVGRGQDTQAAVSRDGRSIVFTAQQLSFNLEVVPFDAERGRPTGPPRQITDGSDVIFFMNFSPDGRSVAYESHRGADADIWRLDQGAAPVRLTGDPDYDDHLPRWSPDGKAIAFMRRRSHDALARNGLWVMASDGANPRLVVEQTSFFSHSWTPDGRGLLYFSPLDGQIYLFDLTTGGERRLTGEPHVSFISVVSPDGKWLVFQTTLAGNIDLRAIPLAGGESRSVVTTPHQDFHPFFSPSGRWLYFQLDHKNIHRVSGPAQGWRPGAPEKVTDFPESGLFLEDPQISRDGRQLLYARGRIAGDLWIMNMGS